MADRRASRAVVAVVVTVVIGLCAYLVEGVSAGHAATSSTPADTATPAPAPATPTDHSTTTTTTTPHVCTRPNFTTSSHKGGTTYGRYYVSNNMWNPLSVKQTLHTCNYDSWFVDASMTSQGGAVQTYPNSQMTFEHRPKLSALASLSSSFAESTKPSGSGDDYEYAYDIWINGYGGAGTSEIMIWNYNHGQSPGGSSTGTFTADGHTFDVYVSGTASAGDYIAFVARSNFTAGTLDLLAFIRDARSHGWVHRGSSARLWQVDYGVEICATGGHRAKFEFTNFDVVPVYR